MAGEPIITVVGNLGGDPELRFTPSGAAVCNFSLAVTPRVKDGDGWVDGTPTWFLCTAWRELGENVAESLQSGARVIVQGRLTTREYEARDGGKGKSLVLTVDAIGPDLRWATAKVTRASRQGGGGGGGQVQRQQGGQTGQADPWSTGGQPTGGGWGDTSDDPPF